MYSNTYAGSKQSGWSQTSIDMVVGGAATRSPYLLRSVGRAFRHRRERQQRWALAGYLGLLHNAISLVGTRGLNYGGACNHVPRSKRVCRLGPGSLRRFLGVSGRLVLMVIRSVQLAAGEKLCTAGTCFLPWWSVERMQLTTCFANDRDGR